MACVELIMLMALMGAIFAVFLTAWDLIKSQPRDAPGAQNANYDPLFSMCYSDATRTVHSISMKGRLSTHCVDTGQCLSWEAMPLHDVIRLDASSDGQRMMVGHLRGAVELMVRERPLQTIPVTVSLAEHQDAVVTVQFSADDRRALSASCDGWVHVYDMATQSVLRRWQVPEQALTDAVFAAEGRRIVVTTQCGPIPVWDVETGEVVAEYGGHKNWVTCSAVAGPDRVFTGGGDATLHCWSAETGERKWVVSVREHCTSLTSLAVTPDGSRIISGSNGGKVVLWDSADGSYICQMKGHFKGVSSLRFSDDGMNLLSASYDGTVCVWDLERQKMLRSF